MLALYIGPAKLQAKLSAFKKEMDQLMPLAELPPVDVPAPAVDDREVPPFPRLRVLALQDDRVCLVVKLHPDSRESGLPRWGDSFKQGLQVVIAVNLDYLEAETGGGVLKKF